MTCSPEPKPLRRSKHHPGAYAALQFGGYQSLDNVWIADERVVWLEMIAAKVPGEGGRLIEALALQLGRYGLALMGTPTPLKLRDWAENRTYPAREGDLLAWYQKRRFRVVQDQCQTRVVFTGDGMKLVTTISFE